MRTNRLRQIWAQDQVALNGWLTIPSSISAEAMAHLGWDSLTLDLQHGPIGFEAALAMLQAVSTTHVVPLVRVPWNDPADIMRALDAGAYGIICPMVNTRAEAEALVAAAKYPPDGFRSFSSTRAALYAGAGYAEAANDTIVTLAMIETAAGLDGLEDIVRVSGLDGVFVGPKDLALALGTRPEPDGFDPSVDAAVLAIARAARAQGKVAGIHCATADQARHMVDAGYNFLTIGSDLRFLDTAGRSTVAEFRR